jgi:hypothetical protein
MSWKNLVKSVTLPYIPEKQKGRTETQKTLTTGEKMTPREAALDERNVHKIPHDILGKRMNAGMLSPEKLWSKFVKRR